MLGFAWLCEKNVAMVVGDNSRNTSFDYTLAAMKDLTLLGALLDFRPWPATMLQRFSWFCVKPKLVQLLVLLFSD